MTKPKLIESIVKATGTDPSKQLNKDQTVFDYMNDQTVRYLQKLYTVVHALPS